MAPALGLAHVPAATGSTPVEATEIAAAFGPESLNFVGFKKSCWLKSSTPASSVGLVPNDFSFNRSF